MVYHHLPKSKSSLKTTPQAIIYYFVTIRHPITILELWLVRKKFLLELKDSLLIMRDQPSLLFRQHGTSSTGPSSKIFVRILLFLIVAILFLLNVFFQYFVICNCMKPSIPDNGTVQFTLFFIMRLNIVSHKMWLDYCNTNTYCNTWHHLHNIKSVKNNWSVTFGKVAAKN